VRDKNLAFSAAELALSKVRIEQAVTIAAGPEAGFNARRKPPFLESGFVRPGSVRVLRTETAALAALAALSALRGTFS